VSLLRRLLIAVLFGSLAILGLAPASTSAAGPQHSPKVIPPQGHPYGRTYGQWNAQWWRWLYQTPYRDNVVLSGSAGERNAPAQVDCSTGQHGKVWFLGGTFLPTSPTPPQLRSDVYRSCSIPAGTALFFPLINTEFDNLFCPNTAFTARELRSAARTGIDDVVPGSLSATIDGKTVRGLNRPDTKYRAPSPWFSYRLPTDNVTQLFCDPPLPEGSRPPSVNGHAGAVADGIYVMLAPLRPGTHTIHFGGELSVPATPAPAPPLAPINFVQNINYTITVTHHR
jgi:hypothetical protein